LKGKVAIKIHWEFLAGSGASPVFIFGLVDAA
jgi:hypothetical protein